MSFQVCLEVTAVATVPTLIVLNLHISKMDDLAHGVIIRFIGCRLHFVIIASCLGIFYATEAYFTHFLEEARFPKAPVLVRRWCSNVDSWLFYPLADCPPHGSSSMERPPYELSTVMFIH